MLDNDANPLETQGYDSAKPAEIELVNGRTIDATHHFRSDDGKWVMIYEGARSDEIDYRVPRENVAVIDTTGDTFNTGDVNATGERVFAHEETWTMTRTACGVAELVPHTPRAVKMCDDTDENGRPVLAVDIEDVTTAPPAKAGARPADHSEVGR